MSNLTKLIKDKFSVVFLKEKKKKKGSFEVYQLY